MFCRVSRTNVTCPLVEHWVLEVAPGAVGDEAPPHEPARPTRTRTARGRADMTTLRLGSTVQCAVSGPRPQREACAPRWATVECAPAAGAQGGDMTPRELWERY